MAKLTASDQLSQARARRVPRLGFNCTGPSRAKQNFKAECDINTIMRKFEKTGVIEHVKQHGARYGDFIDTPQSYQDAVNQVIEAEKMFLSLPAKVRKAFDNDPGELLASVEAANHGDADQVDRLSRLGLLKTTAQPAPAGAPQGAVGEPETAPTEPRTSTTKKASQEAS